MPEWRLTKLRGEFCVTWVDGEGIRRRYRLGTSDPKEASRLATSRYAELTRPRGTKVKDLWDAYCQDMAGRVVVGTMKYTWKALGDRFGGMEASEITIADCRAHTAERRAVRSNRHPEGISDGTIHTELGHLRMVLLWAAKHGLIAEAPPIERPSKPEPKDAHLSRDEVRALIDAAGTPHIKLAVMLMIGTGARNEAALQLTWDRVDFERRMIQLRNPFDRARRKGRATVPMNDSLYDALVEAHKGALSPYVVEWAGQPVKSLKKGLKSAGKAIGRPDVSPHMLRHSAAVWLAEDGHSMHEIAQYLGHDDVKTTTRVYARFSPTHLRKLADSLAV
ncbi:tyrosine-type recombinase/integrase [Aquamicrobium defluvii]|uniref:Integrase n=1 Tax=Aquamicrobium defluvii TaxID=69279 RepID=A0A011UUN8_9HYPH|nr:site-specific integrase [Aquamicrobium defluvii]EXL09598.1 integrase [Aquamicrobium defluvii]EZQ16368.1 integrase [Halopseudomonas bauzanensis]